MTWSPIRARTEFRKAPLWMAVAMVTLAAAFPLLPASAQNNTAPFATGTDCADLSGPRAASCRDAFDPRTNPREWQQRQHPGALHPPEPKGLGRPPASIAPKAPHQPILRPSPRLQRFEP